VRTVKSNWLVIVTSAILFGICIMTVVSGGKAILSSTLSNIKAQSINIGLPKVVISEFEDSYTQNLFGKSYFVEVLGVFNKSLNKQIVLDNEDRYTVYRMTNGQLTHNYVGYDTTQYAENYLSFAKQMEGANIPLLYVQAPFKIDKYDNQLPYGMHDETNPLADNFIQIISEDCDYYDLREEIHNQGLDYASLYYKTDHHWTAETGLWASGLLASKLNDLYDLDLDMSHLSRNEYSFTTYNNYFLGSQGKRTGICYSGLDDFTLIEPKYDTDYTVRIPVLDIERTGSYGETILFKEYMGRNYFIDDPGRVYTGDNYSLMIIENHKSANDTKVLLIKDSYSKSVIPSLASTCRELHVIDMRTYEGSVVEYATENEIDCVVVMYNPSVVVNPKFFEF